MLPLVDYVLVVDTGSTDGTQQMIRDFLAEHHVPGAVIDEPWRDFAYNRTFALERLREVEDVDYAMIIDADDIVVARCRLRSPRLQGADGRTISTTCRCSTAAYRILAPQICSNRLPFSFKGVLHEYLEAPPGKSRARRPRDFPFAPAPAARAARIRASTRTTRRCSSARSRPRPIRS